MTESVVKIVAKKTAMSGGTSVAATSLPIDLMLHRLTEALKLLAQEVKQFFAGIAVANAQGALSDKEKNELLQCRCRVTADILRVDGILTALLPHLAQAGA